MGLLTEECRLVKSTLDFKELGLFAKPKVKVESPLKLKLWGYQRVISEICCLSVPWPIVPIS